MADEATMSLANDLEILDRSSRRLIRLPFAIRRMSEQQLREMLHSYGTQEQVASPAAKLRSGWLSDPTQRALYNPQVVAAQERINQLLVEDQEFRAKLKAADSAWSEDDVAFRLHAVTDALVYRKTERTSALIDAIYGPLEPVYPWDTLGHTQSPPWLPPQAV